MGWDGSCCSCPIGCGLRLLEYHPRQEAGGRVVSDGSYCSHSIGCVPRLLEYLPRQEAGSRVSSDRSRYSRSIGCRLRLLEYRPPQGAGSRVDKDGSCLIRRGLRLLEYSPRQEAGGHVGLDGSCSCSIGRGLRLLENRREGSWNWTWTWNDVAVCQLPVAEGTGTTVAAAPPWKRTLPAPSGTVVQTRATVTRLPKLRLSPGSDRRPCTCPCSSDPVRRRLQLAPARACGYRILHVR